MPAPSELDEPDSGSRRLPAGRKAELAAYVTDVGEVTVARLAERFEVSPDTIRRDLDQLDAEGVLIRTHGGAVSLSATSRIDTHLDVRAKLQVEAKRVIASRAASRVPDGSSLLINAGTTTLALARSLSQHHDLTIATNSLALPAELDPKCFRDLYVFGGAVRMSAQATVGAVAFPVNAGNEIDIQADFALIAVGAVSHDKGFSTSNVGEAVMMSDMMARAKKVIVMADSSKFDRRLFAQISDLSRADIFVTETEPPEELAEALRMADVEVVTPASDGRELLT